MITKLVNPDINDKIGDMACGTGGFLVSAYQHILEKYTPKEHIEYDEQGNVHSLTGANLTDDKHWKKLRTNTFFGYDNDQTMVKIALMNLMLHGITEPHIKEEDTLSENYEESAEKFTVLLENPPFKGTIDSSLIHKDLKLLNTKKTELLFVKKSLDLLEVGGRLGIILPDGVLFGSSKAHKALREEIIEENTLDAVISLPSGVFKPYAGVSTAILIIKKGGETSKTWFYNMTSDGYSLDDKRNFIDGKGDITDIVENFLEKDEGRTGKCFFVESQERQRL
jgi:type I restriction enzyme M protein